MKLQIQGPDGKKYEIDAQGDPAKAAEKFGTEMGWTKQKSFGEDALDTARVAGTAAVQGVTDIANIPSSIAAMAGPVEGVQSDLRSWVRRQLGMAPQPDVEKMLTDRATQTGTGVSKFLNVKPLVESVGLPTDARKEAQRLGADTDLNRAIAGAVRTGTGMLAMGAGRVGAGLAALGAGVGQEIGGDTGEFIGSLAGPGIGLISSRAVGNRALAKASTPPTTEVLKDSAQAAYKAAEDAGVIITKPALERLQTGIVDDLTRHVYRPALHPKTAMALSELSDDVARGASTLENVDSIRKVFKAAMDGAGESDKWLLSRMTSRLDNFLTKLTPADVIMGDATKGVEALQAARSAWSKGAKGETIENLVDRAKTRAPNFSASGMENAIRTEFRQLSLNPRKMRMFSEEEQAAIRKVAEGTTVGNIERAIGRFAPKGVITGALHGASIAANPIVGIPVAAAATAARALATASTTKNARMAAELMRRGSAAPTQPISDRQRQMIRALLAGGSASAVQ